MALVSRIRNRRKTGSHKVSGQSEACETRALLSAAAVSGAEVVDVVESPGDESPILDEQVTSEDCMTDGTEAEPLSPEEFTRFMTLLIAPVPEGLVLPEGSGMGEASIAEEIGPPVDAWDPTWLYPTMTPEGETDPLPFEEVGTVDIPLAAAPEGWTNEQWQAWNSGPMTPEQMEQLGILPGHFAGPADEWTDEGPVNGPTLEDPSIGWAYGPGGEDPSDGPVGSEAPEIVTFDFGYPEDPSISWVYGPDGKMLKENLDWSWVLYGPLDGIEGELATEDSFVLSPFDPLSWDESFGVGYGFADVTDGSEFEIVDGETNGEYLSDGSEIFADGGDIPYCGTEPEIDPEIYFAMSFGSVGGSDMQRSVDEVELPPASTPIFSSVAARTTVLFEDRDAAVQVSSLIAQTEEPIAAVSDPVLQPISPTVRSKSRGPSTSSVTAKPEELNGLIPLLEGSDEPVALELKPADSEENPSDETVSVIDSRDSSNTAGAVAAVRSTPVSGVVRVRHATRSGSVAIDQFMTQYAQNSFMS